MKITNVSRWRMVLQQFVVFSSVWACVQALLALHALGQDIWHIVIPAILSGVLFVTLLYFYNKDKSAPHEAENS
jgi:lipopolysaccharide export LptBFGC system permease protein LptF